MSDSGGFYWASRSYSGAARRAVRSTPTEMLCKGLLTVNHLMHSRVLTAADVPNIANAEFCDLIQQIGARLFTPGSGCALYRCDLPVEALIMIKDHRPDRLNPVTGVRARFKARIRHEVFFQPEWVYHTEQTEDDDAIISRFNESAIDVLTDPQGWPGRLPGGPRFARDFARLLDDGALLPCDNTNLEVLADNNPGLRHHYTYGEFMGGKMPPPEYKKPLLKADSPLYWVDLLQLSFKHGDILNEGDINKREKTGYKVTDNIRAAIGDPDFFWKLMRRAHGPENQLFILPLLFFVMNGRLYSHDHKRAAASLLAGQRYILGGLNQSGRLARVREVGYHPAKGLYAAQDQGMFLYLTVDDMARWGHHFFRVGGPDHTPLLHGQPFAEPEWLDPDFTHLHEMCRPTLLRSLNNPDRLRARMLALLNEGLRKIRQLRDAARSSFPRGKLRKALVQGGILPNERAEAVVAEGPAAVEAALRPYLDFFNQHRPRVEAMRQRDELLRWELDHVGNPFPAVVGKPYFDPKLRDRLLNALPVLERYLEEEDDG
ncbi:MAG: hypothetical protein AAFV53_20855 [Myxococcota bacterium]